MQATADAERLQGWTLELPAAEVLAQARILARQLKPEQKILVMLPKPEVSEISSQLRRSAG
jgi:broad specificity phosphatase PhoE